MYERVIRNRWAKGCSVCKTQVAAEAGFAATEGKPKGWVVLCVNCMDPADIPKEDTRKELTLTGELYHPMSEVALPLLRSLPKATDGRPFWDKTKICRNVSLAPRDRPRLLEICAKLGVKVPVEFLTIPTDDTIRALLDYADGRGAYPYQIGGIEWLSLRDRGILADDMGLGKTLQVLMALRADEGAIIVCPNSLKLNWRDEAEKWRPDLTSFVCKGGRKGGYKGKHKFHWPAAGELVIINYESLPKEAKLSFLGNTWGRNNVKIYELDTMKLAHSLDITEGELKDRAAKTALVLDEAHKVKSFDNRPSKGAALAKASKALGEICGRVWFLTGTPLMSRPTDLKGLLNCGGMFRETFGSYKNFCRLFNAGHDGYGTTWGAPLPEVPELLRRVMLRRLKTEVLENLPPKTFTTMVVDTSGKEITQALNGIDTKWGDALRRGQLPPFEAMSEVRAKLAASRIPAVEELVEGYEDAGTPLVVFGHHRAAIEALGARDGWECIVGGMDAEVKDSIVKAFQAGKLKGIAGTIGAMGTGLTLTHASTMIFVDMSYTPAENTQAEDRINRIGQTASNCHYIRLVSEHPVDRRVHDLLVEKAILAADSIEDRKYVAEAPKVNDLPVALGNRTHPALAGPPMPGPVAATAGNVPRNEGYLGTEPCPF